MWQANSTATDPLVESQTITPEMHSPPIHLPKVSGLNRPNILKNVISSIPSWQMLPVSKAPVGSCSCSSYLGVIVTFGTLDLVSQEVLEEAVLNYKGQAKGFTRCFHMAVAVWQSVQESSCACATPLVF